MRFFIFLIFIIFFSGCAQKIDTSLLQKHIKAPSTLYTYNPKEDMIKAYFFSEKADGLYARSFIKYLPIDYTGQLYDPFSNVTWTLYRLSKGEYKTLEEILQSSVKSMGNKRLFVKKDEFIVDTDLARELIRAIEEFERKIEKQEERDEDEIIFPVT